MGSCNSLFQNQCLSSKENIISTALVFNFQIWFTQSKQSMIFAIEQVFIATYGGGLCGRFPAGIRHMAPPPIMRVAT